MKFKLIMLIVIFTFSNLGLVCFSQEDVQKLHEDRKKLLDDAIELQKEFYKELNAKHYLKAMDLINELLKIKPDECLFLSQKGRLKFYLGYYESSVKFLNKAVEICPEEYSVYLKRAKVLEKIKGNYKFVIEDDLEQAIKLSNEEYEPMLFAATYYIKQGYYGKAIKLLNRIIELHSEDFRVLNCLGTCYHKLNKYDKALECFNKSVELESTNFYIMAAKARFHFNYKEYNESLSTYLKALKLMPKFYKKDDDNYSQARFINRIAFNYYKLGNYKEANKYSIKAMNYKTKDPVIVKDRALILLKLKQKEKALIYYFKARDLGYRSYINSENDDIELLLSLKKQYVFYNDLDRNLHKYSKIIRFFL